MRAFAVGVAAVLVCSGVVADPVRPTFPNEYSVMEKIVLRHSNGEEQQGIAMAYHQISSEHNRTAVLNVQGLAVSTVYDFDNTNGSKPTTYFLEPGKAPNNRCEYSCPANDPIPCNLPDSLCSYDYLHSAKYNGTVVINGAKCNSFTWMEGIGPIPMNYLTLYVNQATNEPVKMVRNITPFGGASIGLEYLYFSNFTVGTPPDSVFDVPNQEYCQQYDDDTAQCEGASVSVMRKL